jgi:hypothetical protein
MTIFHGNEIRFSDLMTRERFEELKPFMVPPKSEAERQAEEALREEMREYKSHEIVRILLDAYANGEIATHEVNATYQQIMTEFDKPKPVEVPYPYEYI